MVNIGTETRELDAEVAQKVMGWKWCTFCERTAVLMPPYLHEDYSKRDWSSWKDGIGPNVYIKDYDATTFIDSSRKPMSLFPPAPNYSTSMLDAMEVIREMEKKFFLVQMGHVIPEIAAKNGTKYFCTFGRNFNGVTKQWESEALELPMAVCLAAVRAVDGGLK